MDEATGRAEGARATGGAAKPRRGPAWLAALALAVLVPGAGGCGDDAPEERLAEAQQAVSRAEAETQQAQREVERLRSRVAAREAEVQRAERALTEAQDELRAAATRVEERATDVALFRAVQTRLLEDDTLEPYAVSASVEDGVVTLHGAVETYDEADHAARIARETFGVIGTRNRLQIGESVER
jgi:osmotically-inducible protein OsmY